MTRAASLPASGKPKVVLSTDAVLTLVNHGIYQLGNALSAILINLYLWRLTNDLWVNGLYNLTALLAAGMSTLVIGKAAKQKNSLLVYQLGILFTVVFYLGILIVREGMVELFALFAILRGISNSFYWLGHFTMIVDVSDNDDRHKYLGWDQMITNCASLTGPALAGWLTVRFSGMQGYMLVYGLALALFTVAFIASLKLTKKGSVHKSYLLKYTWAIGRKHRDYGRALAGWFLLGIPQGVMSYIPLIILYQAFSKESIVGYLNVCFSALMIIGSFLMSKRAKSDRTRFYLSLSAWPVVAAACVLIAVPNLWTIILFLSIHAVTRPMQSNAYSAHYYKLSGELPLRENFRVEAVVARESVINAGRSIGVVFFMATSGLYDGSAIYWILALAMASQLMVGPLIGGKSRH